MLFDKNGQVLSDASFPAPARQVLPTTLLVLPIQERPFFPQQIMPLLFDESVAGETVERAGNTPHHLLGIVLLDPGAAPEPDSNLTDRLHRVGTVVRIHNVLRHEGRIQFLAQGVERFQISAWMAVKHPLAAQVRYPQMSAVDVDEVKPYSVAIVNSVKELLPLNPLYGEELKLFLNNFSLDQPSPLADFAANLTTASREELQEVLETVEIIPRIEMVLLLLRKELNVARLQTEIRERVSSRVHDQQREFFLKAQLKEIQKELGIARDDRTVDRGRFEERLEHLILPAEVKARIDEELEKLAVLEIGSPEYGVTRNYLDWITAVPWGKHSEDHVDLEAARQVLDRDHSGLDDVKTRIIEFLAVGAYRQEVSGSILLLVGPPGVGKTSIGRSIAEVLGRGFYRFSLGGMRDEAEIKGHRRTYIGAMPGKLVQALKAVGNLNPVIMLDEIDKVGASYQGDPASALLEVLDPEQNSAFLDHYLDVRCDLSRVLFICTANQPDTIPPALVDRMETIRIAGYLTQEKVTIARRHLWPRRLARAGVPRGRIRITDAALRAVAEGYAREAGVRGLDQQLDRIVRHAVVELMESKPAPRKVSARNLEDYLGPPRFREPRRLHGVGVVTGLAWTSLGGTVLNVEATLVHRQRRGLQLTGHLGEVMSESANIAYSYVSSNLKRLGGKAGYFDQASVHVHVPEGATPKDGPSAGITVASALLSLSRRRRIIRPLAMTGELTLTGEVLAVGGIREKVLAARRNRIDELILPAANARDFSELPHDLREGLEVHLVDTFRDVAKLLFR